jgi:3-methyladenine DNA glycosylase Tag
MEGPPPQYNVKTLDEYLEHLSKGVFQAGISWRVVDAKWPTIKKAFRGFDAERVARMTDRDIDALAQDERVIRSRPKLAAVVHNANELLALERAGGFKKHLKSFSEYEPLAADLKKRFKFVGDSGVYHFLWTVKHPVPEWREWARAHNLDWEAKVKSSGQKRRRASRPRAAASPSGRAGVRSAR